MQPLCTLDELSDNEGRGFSVEIDGEPCDIVVVRRATRVYAYRNVCPHQGTSLDWMPDRFMDPARQHLQCATHGARFEVETGRCVAGPCRGTTLTAVAVTVVDGYVLVTN